MAALSDVPPAVLHSRPAGFCSGSAIRAVQSAPWHWQVVLCLCNSPTCRRCRSMLLAHNCSRQGLIAAFDQLQSNNNQFRPHDLLM